MLSREVISSQQALVRRIIADEKKEQDELKRAKAEKKRPRVDVQ